MSNYVCPVVTPTIQEIYEEIQRLYPEASAREGLTVVKVAEWVGNYSSTNSIPVDNITKKDAKAIVNLIEKQRNMDGGSFKEPVETITYNYQGSKREYKIRGNKIYNKDGKEVFTTDSKDRRKIFANLAVQQGRAVVVEHKGKKYVVNNRNQIISVTTGDEMKWGEENGDRKEILRLSQIAFREKQKAESATTNSGVAQEGVVNRVVKYYSLQLNALGAYLVPQTDGKVLETDYWKQLQSIGQRLQSATTVEDAKDIFNSALKAPNQKIQDVVNTFVAGKYEGTWTPKREKDAWEQIDATNPLKVVSIPQQLIDHLKNMKLNVGDKAAIEKFFKEHPNTLIQQALEEQREMHDIKAKAIADGTFMKAPNGKPTNLTERQWLQVRTKNFINWFGDWINDPEYASKVVDENGEPLVVYHGTTAPSITKFRTSHPTIFGNGLVHDGAFFTSDEEYAKNIIKYRNNLNKTNYEGKVYPVFLRIINPEYSTEPIRNENIYLDGYDFAYSEDYFKGYLDSETVPYELDGIIGNDYSDAETIKHGLQPSKGKEYVVKFGSQIKSATDNNGMFSTENDDIQMAIGWNTSIEDVLAEYPTLDYDLSKFNSQAMEYGHTKNGVGYVIYNGNYVVYSVDKDGMARPIIELSGTNEILKILENEFEESNNPRDFIRRADKAWDNKQGGYKSNPSYIRNRRQYGRNDSQDRRQGGLRRENGLERGSKDSNITQEFITPQGEVYGFVDKDGNMYLDETVIDASHPIHEYTHLWDRALAKINPQLWQKGIKLMQEGVPVIWNEITNSAQYGKLWQSQGIKGDKLISLIASEVHARLVGDNGAKLLDEIAKEQGQEGIIAKLKQWIVDAWKELKKTFSNWSQEEIDKLTLKDFNHMTVRDFADGINPNTVSSPSNAASNAPQSNSASSPFDAVLDGSLENEVQSSDAVRAFNNKPKPEKPKSVAYESALDVKDSRVAQFKRVFSPQQIKDRGAMISNIFSRIIDEHLWDLMDKYLSVLDNESATEQQKNDAIETLHKLKDPITGRQFAAQDKQLSIIMDEIKQELQWDLEGAPEEMKQLWQNTIDYFEDLFNTQATLDIEEREGIRIVGLELQQTVSENEADEQNDGDDEVGHIVSGSDGWNYQVRYTNPFDSLSRKVRGMLYEVERPSSEKDDLGQTRYYPMGQIYASLLSYLAKNMQDSDAFMQVDHSNEGQDRWGNDINETSYPNGYPIFPVLEQMAEIYPWVRQIISRLTDDYLNPEWNTNLRYPSTGGAMASQFYTNFRKAYIPYGKIELGINPSTGKPYFGVTPLNYQMEERAQLDKLKANYNNRMILSEHSIYNSDGKVNKENANWLKQHLKSAIDLMDRLDLTSMPELMEYHAQHPEEETLTPEDIQEYNDFLDNVRMLLQSFGIDATQDGVVAYLTMENGATLRKMLSDLEYISDLISKVEDSRVDSFNYMVDTRNPYGENQWVHFFDGRGLITDASYMQSFYDSASKKTKYSYSADNYLMKTFRGVCMGTLDQRRKYIDEHFGKFEWFRRQNVREGNGWRNAWLEFFYNYEGDLTQLPYRNIDNVTEYGKNGAIIRPYSKWTSDDIWQVQNRSYNPEAYHQNTAFYLTPIFSDSPMSMTVIGPKMSMNELLYGYTDAQNESHQGAFINLVNQELWRIQYVQQRAKAIEEGRIKPIANFDTGVGQLFCFLPELNSYTFDGGETFLDRMMRLKKEKATLKEIEAQQIQAIEDIMNSKMEEFVVENKENYKGSELQIEQYYNMAYANAAIIQMTTVDLAFYGKGQRKTINDTIHQMTVDFQKRFKEVYAGGIQLNTNSKYGKKTENILLLSDDIITSPSYDKIAAIIDGSKTLSESDKKDIKDSFQDINVADAQAIRSMHSFRSILDMMGNWTDDMETALQHFKDGTWDRADFDIIYQTIKPFVYSVIERNDGNGGSILVPQQNKNSEICALMMYDLITNGLDNSPVYKALSKFMEETLDGDGNPLIDMIQFESAGKVGNQGVVNISFNPNKVIAVIENGVTIDGREYEFFTDEVDNNKFLPNDVENAEANYKAIKHHMDWRLQEGRMSQDDYNKIMSYLRPTEDEIISMLEQAAIITNPDGTKGINTEVVHTIPFDNYYQQQPTPEHHIDAEATYGSQARNIAVADLPDNFEMTLSGKGGSKTFKGKDAIIDFCYELLNENLIEDFFGKGSNKGLKGLFSSKEALRDAVTEIVRGNPKYGRDFAEALQIDDNGNFVLSPNSPTIFNLMQEIITSFFKNRITKQTINGAALIQAAGIGLDKDLRMKFDNDGKLLGAECLMPLTSKRLFEPLLETKIIDGKEVQVLDPKKLNKAGLDKAIGYRIPTENKSSMMPLIIKDFTPLQNGSAIVLPAEITDIAGSDFDVDKMFIMLLSFTVQNYNKGKARKEFAKNNPTYTASLEFLDKMGLLDEDEDAGLSEDEDRKFNEWFKANKENYLLDEPIIREIKYDFNKTPKENGRKARNNMLIQMMFNILTSKEGSESLLNPQGFKDFKRAAKINRILTDDNLREQLIQNTEGVTPGVIPSPDKIIGEFLNLLQEKYPDRYNEYKTAVMKLSAEDIQKLYVQAITAGNKTDAINLLLNSPTKYLEKFINEYSAPESPVYPQTFTHSHAKNMAGALQIGIYAIQASMDAKYQRADVRLRPEQQFILNGRVIANVDVSDGGKRLKNVGQMVGASADNGKDPNLSDAGSTTKTAPIIGYMLRTGMSHLEAVLIINQHIMKDSDYNPRTGYWKEVSKAYKTEPPINVTTDMLIRGIFSPFELTTEERRGIAHMCYKILLQHEAQEYLTQISRADSPNGAMQNSYAKARIQRYKVDLFNAKMGQTNFPFVRIKEALSNDAVDTTASEEIIREQLKGQRMAFLHGMYALGINSFNGLVNPYFFGAKQWFDDRIVKPILYNMNEKLSDDKKEKIVNGIYVSYITYMLSGASLFGNEENASMKQKRDYYLKSFPSDYQKILQENGDIRELLGNILQVKSFGSRKRVILQDVGSLSKGQKQDVQRRFDALLYSDNPTARNLAKDLLIYSYFDNGLQFTHDSFSHLFTTEFLTNFPAYTDTLNWLDKEITSEEEQNFIHQFLLTYHEAAYNVNDILKGASGYTITDSQIIIDLSDKGMRKRMINEVMSPNPQLEGINVYPYIQYNKEIYVLDQDMFEQYPGMPVYNKLTSYQTAPKFPLFSIEMSVAEMAKEFPVGEKEQESFDNNIVDDFIAHNEGDGDPSIGSNSMYDNLVGVGSMYDAINSPEVIQAEEAGPSDTYQSEGKAELKDPFCEA